MALQEIELMDLVDALDEINSEYSAFFRPMLGYEAILKLYLGITDADETLLIEIEDETAYEFPPDLVSFYICTNGGIFGDLELYPLTTDTSVNSLHRLNVIDKSLKESIGLDNKTLLIGGYPDDPNTYITCKLNKDGTYVYQMYDAAKQKVRMEFEYIIQLVALEVNYVTDYDELVEYANGKGE
jgi:hypothetical protein